METNLIILILTLVILTSATIILLTIGGVRKFIVWLYFKTFPYVVDSGPELTPAHLILMGWELEGNCYVEPNVKLRDKIWVQFEYHYYRIYHGPDKTFIDLKSGLTWFMLYLRILGR